MYRRAPQGYDVAVDQNEGDTLPLTTYQPITNIETEPRSAVSRKPLPLQQAAGTVSRGPSDKAVGGSKRIPTTKSGSGQLLSVLRSWWSEILACMFSIIALVAIVAVLVVYNGRNVTDIGLPSTLTLNGLVAFIATFDRVFLIIPVGSSISQELWLWLSENDNGTKVKSHLRDLDRSDSASRGALGSLVFLLTSPRRPHRRLHYYSLSLVIPFSTQQLITQRNITLLDRTSPLHPGNLARTEHYSLYSGAPSEGQLSATLDTTAALYSGLMSKTVELPQANCPSGNCSWPSTPSLAICGACAPTTPTQSSCNGTHCMYKMPSGTLFELTDLKYWDAEDGVGFQTLQTYGQHWNVSLNDRVYLANIDMMGLPYCTRGVEINDKSFNYTASECALWICVNTYNRSIISGQQQESVTASYYHALANGTFDAFPDNITLQFPDAILETSESTYTNYTVTGFAYLALSEQFTWKGSSTGINGTVRMAQRSYAPSSDTVNAIWVGTSNQSRWIQNLATSMTNVVRTANQTSRQIYDGTAYVQGIHVVWWWIALPAATVAASALLLLVVMIRTARSQVKPWRGSPLTLLFFEVDCRIREAVARTVLGDKAGLGMSDSKVTLRKTEGISWLLKGHQVDTITIDGSIDAM